MNGFQINRAFFARLFSALALLWILGASLPSFAQAPQQPPPVVQTGRSRSLSEQIAGLNVRARQLLPALQGEVMSRVMGWAARFSMLLAALIILGSFLRMWRENDGQGSNLFWWFGRLACCLLLVGSGSAIIDAFYLSGKEIAEGNEIGGAVGRSALFEFYQAQRETFNDSYEKAVDGHFKVKTRGGDFTVKPANGAEEFMGVIYDQAATIRDFNNNLNDSAYTLPKLFTLMGVARGVMEAGDVWLVVLAGLLLMVFKMIAPFMIVLGIDAKLSQRTVYPYLWGLLVLTIIWPSVSYFIRALAYLSGNSAMAMFDGDQLYAWNPETLQALRNPLAQPFYTIALGAAFMLLAGLMLWVSPFIAYSISMGRIYEGVSQTASSFAGSMIGTVAEWWSANVGSKIARQAENVQIQGGYEADTTRSRGELQAANTSAQARRIGAIGSVKGQQITSLSQIHSNERLQIALAQLGRDQQIGANNAQHGLALRSIDDSTRKDITETRIATRQHIQSAGAEAIGGASSIGGHTLGGVLGAGGPGVGALGGVAGGVIQLDGNEKRMEMTQDSALEAGIGRAKNFHEFSDNQKRSHSQYTWELNENSAQYVDGASAAYRANAGQAAAGVNRGTKVQMGSINQSAGLEMQANQERFNTQVAAAGITRNAGLEATNLRAMSHVFSQVAGKVARDIEKGIELRF
jgi:hypothetical protein